MLLSTRNDGPKTFILVLYMLGASNDIRSNINMISGSNHKGIISEHVEPKVTLIIIVPYLVLKLHFCVDNKILVGAFEEYFIREELRS